MAFPWPEVPEPWSGWDALPGAVTQTRPPGAGGNFTLSAGTVLKLLPGLHHISGDTWTLDGTASQPIFVIREPGAEIVDNSALTIQGQYYHLLDLVFTGGARLSLRGPFGTVRECELRDHPAIAGNPSTHVMISPGAGSHDIVVYGNHVHHNDWLVGQSSDLHAVKTSVVGFQNLWVVNNHFHHLGGDGVQIGSATLAEPWPENVWVAGNLMHENGENGVDLKKSRKVWVVENEIWGMVASPGNDPGRAIVIHDGADQNHVLRNNIHDNAGEGIVSTGSTAIEWVGNEIRRSSYGARAYSSSGTAHDNKAWDCGTPFSFNNPSGTVTHFNNLVDPPEGEPPVPAILNVEVTMAVAVSLTWSYPAGAPGLTAQDVVKTVDGGAPTLIAVGPADTSYVDSAVAIGQVNTYAIKSSNAVGTAQTDSKTADLRLPVPADLVVSIQVS